MVHVAGQPKIVDGFLQVVAVGTGFMLIRREVIETLDEQHPELAFGEPAEKRIALFETMIHPKTRRYLPEDFAFCLRCRQAGLKIWANTASKLTHTGTQNFRGISQARWNSCRHPKKAEKPVLPAPFQQPYTRRFMCIRLVESDH